MDKNDVTISSHSSWQRLSLGDPSSARARAGITPCQLLAALMPRFHRGRPPKNSGLRYSLLYDINLARKL